MADAEQAPNFDPGSHRDRSARVVHCRGRILRALTPRAAEDWRRLTRAEFFRSAATRGQIVVTSELSSEPELESLPQLEGFSQFLEHERLPIITWPFEWSFSMLRDAALLTLDLMHDALADGFILKDGTPYNIQFRGVHPLLIDTGSLVPVQSGQTWHGYRQFCQQFLFPLMLQSWKGLDFQPWLRGSLEGIAPEAFSRLLSWRDLLRRGALTHVWLHARLQRGEAQRSRAPQVARSMQASGFSTDMIRNNVSGLQRLVSKLDWKASNSTWSHYDQSAEPVQRDAADKEQFIESLCAAQRWQTVWDLGCNLGRYSRIAARHADLVVAQDSDHLTIDRLYRSLRTEAVTNIVPLVMNLADPSPGLGWNGRERQPLLDRSQPDLVLCLALIHHLVIGSNLLLADVLSWLASLNAVVVLEFVDRSDAQVQVLLANRDDVFTDYSLDGFRALASSMFTIEREQPLSSGTRTLFVMHPVNDRRKQT